MLLIAASCSKKNDPQIDSAKFVRIYDTNKFDASYSPIDVKQTPDSGYLILANRRLPDPNFFNGTYLLKVDKLGAFVSELEVPDDKVAPIGPLLEASGKYYFFSMAPGNYQTQLSEVATDGTITKTLPVGGSYPSAAFNDAGNFVLLRYDNVAKQSVVSLVNPQGSTSKSVSFTIGEGNGVEEKFISHFTRTGRQFPFQVGKTSAGKYFFNGFYKYTFSLVFTDLVNKDPLGVAQGQQADGGFSQLLPLEGSRYAAARFNFGDNYLLPSVTVNENGISSIVNLGGNNLPELVQNAPVKILSLKVNEKDIVLYSSNTKSKQIALFGYDKTTGTFLGSHYLGFSNPFEIASATPTTDGGLAVCGITYVAGKFSRICLFKLSKADLSNSFK